MRIRTILIGIVVIVVGLFVTGYAILKSLDLNDYKDVLEAKVEAATGRELTLNGDIELAISLTPRLSISDVTFANAEWGSRPEMVRLERLEAVVDLMPLLSSEVRVNEFVLVGADVMLETDTQGNPNWGFPGEENIEAAETAGSGRSDYSVSVNAISVERALITFRNGATGETQTVTVDTMTGAAESAAVPIALTLAGSLNGSPVSIEGTLPSVNDLQGGAAMPIDLTIDGGGGTVTAEGTVSPASFDLALTAEGQSLADLGALTGEALPAIGPYRLSAQVTNPDGAYRLGNLDLKMGDSTLTGEATLSLVGSRPAIVADLQSTHIDLADFGIEPVAEEAPPSGGGDGRIFPDDPLPLDILRTIDAAIRFVGLEVVRAPQTLGNVAVDLVLENGRLTVNHLAADLAGGKVAASGIVDASQEPAGISLKLVSSQIEGGSLLQTIGESPLFTDGKIDLAVDVAGSGNSIRQLMASLGGSMDFSMGSGRIDDDFARLMLSDLFQLIASGGADGADLNCVVSRFSIRGGVAQSTALVIDTNGATVLGEGSIDLRSEEPDLLMVPSAKQVNLTNLAVPVRIRGTLSNPSVLPDPGAMAAGLVNTVGSVGTGVFDLLSSVTGGGSESDSGGSGNACVVAIETSGSGSAASPTAGDMIMDGAGQMLEGAGQAGQGIGQGAVDVLEDAGKALEGLFGN